MAILMRIIDVPVCSTSIRRHAAGYLRSQFLPVSHRVFGVAEVPNHAGVLALSGISHQACQGTHHARLQGQSSLVRLKSSAAA